MSKYITKDEMRVTLNALTGGRLSEEDIEALLNAVFEVVDLDGDNRISYEEFAKLVGKTDVASSVSLNLGVASSVF